MDAQRWTNLARLRRAWEAGAGRVEGGPQEIFVEVAARCNLRCRMCAIGSDARYRSDSGRPALLTPELFARLRPIFPTLLRAHLYGLGEPLLNPHLEDFIRELADAGVGVDFTTNGTLMDEARAEAVTRAGADRVAVSVDGATAATYESIRRGARFDNLLRGLEALGRAGRNGGPLLVVNFVAMSKNLHELPALVELCARVGAREVNVEPLFDWGDSSAELAEVYRTGRLGGAEPARQLRCIEEARALASEAGIHFSSRLVAGEGPLDYVERVRRDRGGLAWSCSEPWSTIFLTTAGEVRTCCVSELCLGDLNRQSFAEIWNGPAYARFRRQHAARGAAAPAGCEACFKNGRKRHSQYFAAVEAVSYRPLLDRPAPPPRRGIRLATPRQGDVVTLPLVVTGHLPRLGRARLPWQGRRLRPELLVDSTPVAHLRWAALDGNRFAVVVDAPYITEGAHVLSLRMDREPLPGWSRRTVHLWRPPAGNGHPGPVLAGTSAATAVLPLPRRTRRVEVWVDRRRWPDFRWLCASGPEGWLGVAELDLNWLPAGEHRLEVQPAGLPPRRWHLVRLHP